MRGCDARTHRVPKKIINKSAIANIIRSNWTAEVAISSNNMHQQRGKGATCPKKKISSTKMIDCLKYVKGEYVAVCVIARAFTRTFSFWA